MNPQYGSDIFKPVDRHYYSKTNRNATTKVMNQCSMTVINQLKTIETKYINAIYTRINNDYKDDSENLNELLTYFDKENKAWEELINATSTSTYIYWQGGTIRGVMRSGRKIELIKCATPNYP